MPRWKEIPWIIVERTVLRIQKRIFRATREGDFRNVKFLQKLLSGSRDARLLAIRRVTQLNNGRYTAGIDGKIYDKDEDRELLFEEIKDVDLNTYKCMAVLRVFIPKPNKDEKRPLGIPTIIDRVLQMIVKLALEPEFEAKFERNSYGFRPGRRCMDAIHAIHGTIAQRKGAKSSAWILDADIAKCFDNIDHEALLQKIPVFQNVIRGWLKAGAIEFGRFTKTVKGTPQGGIISPLLANIALDGMDQLFGAINSSGKYCCPSHRYGGNKGIMIVRYADDFVVIAPSREILVEYVIPRLREFLRERGLSLSGAKTRIIHREEGFDFLGFHVQQFAGTYNKLCTVRPAKGNVQRLLGEVKKVLMENKQTTQEKVIDILNPKLRGWANYFRFCHAKETFSYVDYRVFRMLWWWSQRRHDAENKNVAWVKGRYFIRIGNRGWIFADKSSHALYITTSQKCDMKSYIKVKGDASPYDPSLNEYWLKRHGKIPQEA